MKCEMMTSCFHECFEVSAFDDVLGIEPEFHAQFRKVVDYYKRFWLKEIGPQMISQFDSTNRTNNHAEAFHRGIGQAVLVAHPQTLVLIRLLINIERDALLRFNDQRSGKTVKRQNKRFEELESAISSAMRSYGEGLFRNDTEYLSAIAKLYVEYNHRVKTERFRNNTALLERVSKVKNAVVKALEDQNLVIFGDEIEERTGEDDDAFVDADFHSEILFDTTLTLRDEEHIDDQSNAPAEQTPGVPMEMCPVEISDKRRRATKPKPGNDTAGTPAKRRKRTLLQRMRKNR